MKKILNVASLFILLFSLFSCSTGAPRIYKGGFDPLYNMKTAKTVGFTPFCWVKQFRCDEILEKRAYVAAKHELEKRGYTVFYIEPQFLISKGNEVYVKTNYKRMPDLTLTFGVQSNSFQTKVPDRSYGNANVNAYRGYSNYSSSEGYVVNNNQIALGLTLWSDAPTYMKKAWEGTVITLNPSIKDDAQWVSSQIQSIFVNKFDKK